MYSKVGSRKFVAGKVAEKLVTLLCSLYDVHSFK